MLHLRVSRIWTESVRDRKCGGWAGREEEEEEFLSNDESIIHIQAINLDARYAVPPSQPRDETYGLGLFSQWEASIDTAWPIRGPTQGTGSETRLIVTFTVQSHEKFSWDGSWPDTAKPMKTQLLSQD